MNANELKLQISSYNTVLKPFALSLTRNIEDSEDLVQDTIIRALTHFDKFKQGTNLKAWLFTIMRNIFINNYRRKARRNTLIDQTENLYFINSGDQSVANGGEASIIMEEIEKALQEVSSEHTIPFLMYYEGYKYEEIADTLELPLGTVKSRIFLARKALKQKLENTREK